MEEEITKKLEEYITIKKKEGGIGKIIPSCSGNIPVLFSSGKGLAEAWENSLLALYKFGCGIRTQYDKKDEKGNYIDPPSLDCSMIMCVEEPFSEPVIHRSFPGGLEDLEEYRQEVCLGIKNSWVRDPINPIDSRWEYTYNERLFNFAVPLNQIDVNLKNLPKEIRENFDIIRKEKNQKPLEFLLEQDYIKIEKRPVKNWIKEKGEYKSVRVGEQEFLVIDQIKYIIEKLSSQPFTRQAQAITWQPQADTLCFDPPCLQSFWFRILKDENGIDRLNTNMRFRSRDAYKAAFMNDFAFINLIDYVRNEIEKRSGETLLLGRFVDQSDSYHIYGFDMKDFQKRFITQVLTRSFEDRTWTLEYAKPLFEEAKPKIEEKIKEENKKHLQQKE